MSKAVRDHLRGNVVGYIALFCFAMSGTALATHPGGANTISSGDIINGEVQTADIGTNEVTAADIGTNQVTSTDIANATITNADLANDSVNVNKITSGAVRTEEIGDGGVESADVLDNALTADDLGTASVASDEIANETVTTNDLQSNSVQFDEIEDQTIGKADIGAGAVGASELGDGVVTRAGTAVTVPGGTAQNGAYDVETSTVTCNAGEELIGGNGQWVPDDNSSGDFELWIAEVRLNTTTESVIVDGGNDSGTDHSIQAVAVCLQV